MSTESVDLSPPWVDESPLSKEPFEQLKTSVASGLRLPQDDVGFGKMFAIDEAGVQKFRHLITPMVELYSTYHDQLETFQETIITSVIRVLQPLMLHRTEASLYYTVLFSAISAINTNSEGTPYEGTPPRDIILIVVKRLTSRFTRIYDNASGAIKQLGEFREGLSSLKPVVDKLRVDPRETPIQDDSNASRNKGVSSEPEFRDIMELQKEAIESEIDSIIENTKGVIGILQEIQGEMEQLKNKVKGVQQRVVSNQPIPTGYIVPEQRALIDGWTKLGDVVEKWTESAYIAKEWE